MFIFQPTFPGTHHTYTYTHLRSLAIHFPKFNFWATAATLELVAFPHSKVGFEFFFLLILFEFCILLGQQASEQSDFSRNWEEKKRDREWRSIYLELFWGSKWVKRRCDKWPEEEPKMLLDAQRVSLIMYPCNEILNKNIKAWLTYLRKLFPRSQIQCRPRCWRWGSRRRARPGWSLAATGGGPNRGHHVGLRPSKVPGNLLR